MTKTIEVIYEKGEKIKVEIKKLPEDFSGFSVERIC